jgi:serine/threonine-protein kinase HipA
MALKLYGRANRLSRNNFIEAGERLGIRERATKNMIDSIVDVATAWPDRCDEIGFDDRITERLAKMLNTRLGSLR